MSNEKEGRDSPALTIRRGLGGGALKTIVLDIR